MLPVKSNISLQSQQISDPSLYWSDYTFPQLPDPPLTPLGISQCEALYTHLQCSDIIQRVELIVVSPMRHTIQTMGMALKRLIEQGVPILPHADWQENANKPCDTGTAIATIARKLPEYKFILVYTASKDSSPHPYSLFNRLAKKSNT